MSVGSFPLILLPHDLGWTWKAACLSNMKKASPSFLFNYNHFHYYYIFKWEKVYLFKWEKKSIFQRDRLPFIRNVFTHRTILAFRHSLQIKNRVSNNIYWSLGILFGQCKAKLKYAMTHPMILFRVGRTQVSTFLSSRGARWVNVVEKIPLEFVGRGKMPF